MLQLRSVEFARNHGVRLHLRSTFTGADGTWVTEEDEMLEKAIISGVTHTLEETVYKISCHVGRDEVERAVQVLHETFGLDRPVEERAA